MPQFLAQMYPSCQQLPLILSVAALAFSTERQEDDLANSSAWKLSYCLLLGQMLYHARRLNPERIKYKQFLRLFDTAQGITTDRSKPTSFLFWNSVHKRLRHEYIALDRFGAERRCEALR